METPAFQSRLIAHRGYSECFPENSQVGLEAALQAGAGCIEFDVQLSTEGVPVVIHDMGLRRTAEVGGDVCRLSLDHLKTLYIGEIGRFGEKFAKEPIPTLAEVLKLLREWTGTTAFVEIKTESIDFFGVEFVVRNLLSELMPYTDQCVLISFDNEILEVVKARAPLRIGWVIPDWNDESLRRARELEPDFLFSDIKILPDKEDALWKGGWQWALYDIVDPQQALLWFKRGVRLIETWDIGTLLGDQDLMSYLERHES